jgi:hypothetical protein
MTGLLKTWTLFLRLFDGFLGPSGAVGKSLASNTSEQPTTAITVSLWSSISGFQMVLRTN